jgi:hypothetical protein
MLLLCTGGIIPVLYASPSMGVVWVVRGRGRGVACCVELHGTMSERWCGLSTSGELSVNESAKIVYLASLMLMYECV